MPATRPTGPALIVGRVWGVRQGALELLRHANARTWGRHTRNSTAHDQQQHNHGAARARDGQRHVHGLGWRGSLQCRGRARQPAAGRRVQDAGAAARRESCVRVLCVRVGRMRACCMAALVCVAACASPDTPCLWLLPRTQLPAQHGRAGMHPAPHMAMPPTPEAAAAAAAAGLAMPSMAPPSASVSVCAADGRQPPRAACWLAMHATRARVCTAPHTPHPTPRTAAFAPSLVGAATRSCRTWRRSSLAAPQRRRSPHLLQQQQTWSPSLSAHRWACCGCATAVGCWRWRSRDQVRGGS